VPAPRFDHLRALTDDVGVFQHAPHGIPERAHGYCTDDVGRALVVAVEGAVRGDCDAAGLVPGYLSFLQDAQQPNGRFANLMGYDRRFQESTASQDTLGQALWGLGVTVGRSPDPHWRALAAALLERAVPALGPPARDPRRGVRHDRAWSATSSASPGAAGPAGAPHPRRAAAAPAGRPLPR
jgi:hypothetical protein